MGRLGRWPRALMFASVALMALAVGGPAQAAPFVYVTNELDNSVSMFRVEADGRLTTLGSASAPGRPRGIAVTPDGRSAYVATTSGQLAQYDVATDGKLTPKTPPTVDAAFLATGIAVSPDGRSVYVAVDGALVFQFDVGRGGALSFKDTRQGPSFAGPLGLTPDAKSAYVAAESLFQYDVAGGVFSPKAPASILFPGNPAFSAFGLAVSPNGRSVYVSGGNIFNAGTVFQYDVGAGGALTPKTPPSMGLLSVARRVAVSPDSRSVYAALDDSVAQLDADARGVLTFKNPAFVPASFGPRGLAVSPDGKSLWVASTRDPAQAGPVARFDVGSGGKLSRVGNDVAAGKAPFALVVSPAVPTAGADVLTGTARGDVICGRGGADVIRGLQGNDDLSGDRCGVRASAARAKVRGGNDRVFGGRGSDRLSGGVGRDRLDGGPGRDTISTRGGGRDIVRCGTGRDLVRADQRDRIRGCERVRRPG